MAADIEIRRADALESFESPSGAFAWRVVNDNVMGGRSRGGYDVVDGTLLFAGSTNTNGGGFSSLRSGPLDLDLSAYDGVQLDLVGDGRRYTWRLTTDATWRGRPVAYWAEFGTVAGAARTVNVPFSRFVPRFRGTRLPGPPLNTARITGMGLMIYDGDDGAFQLSVSEVRAYDAPFSLADFRWRKRVLVVAAPDADDARLRQQLADIGQSLGAFRERDLELILLLSDGAVPPGLPVLSSPEQRALREQLRIADDAFAVRLLGKDGSVKRDDAAPVAMQTIYDLVDGMPMRRREMRERDAGR
ncbi:MAG: CIA30 family protein [Pseudomonadota bacterium]